MPISVDSLLLIEYLTWLNTMSFLGFKIKKNLISIFNNIMQNRIIATTIKAIRWQVLPQNLKIFYEYFGVKLFTYLGFVITTICTCLHLFDLESKLYTDILLVLFIFSLIYLVFILKKSKGIT